MGQLISGTQIVKAVSVTNGAAGTTDIKGETIDSANCEGVMFVAQLGAIASTAVTALKLQHSDTTTDGDFTDVADTDITVADDDDEEVRYLDYRRPTKRYVRLYVDRATAAATITATALRYGLKSQPETQPTGIEGVSVSG